LRTGLLSRRFYDASLRSAENRVSFRRRPPLPQLSHSPIRSHVDVEPGAQVVIGRGVSVGPGFSLSSYGSVTIGDGTVFGPFVQILDSDLHAAGAHGVIPEPEPVRIGRGVTVGAWSTILPGATIGDEAVVEPYSVVSGAVAERATVGGNPATPRATTSAVLGGQTAAELVSNTMQATFGLGPDLVSTASRDTVPAWNSLGAVRLLAALSEATGTVLPDNELLSAISVGEVIAIVERTIAR
jgi:acetyltransferase-like isoleucine patch superfamily enzyme/acyl carrier protein